MRDFANIQHLPQAKSLRAADKSERFIQIPDYIDHLLGSCDALKLYYGAHKSYSYGHGICFAGWDKMAEDRNTKSPDAWRELSNRCRSKGLVYRTTHFNFGRKIPIGIWFDDRELASQRLRDYHPAIAKNMSRTTANRVLKEMTEFFKDIPDYKMEYKKSLEELQKCFDEEVPKSVPIVPNSTFSNGVALAHDIRSERIPSSFGTNTIFVPIKILREGDKYKSLSPISPYGKNLKKDEGSKYQPVEIPKHQLQPIVHLSDEDQKSEIANELQKRRFHPNFVQALLNHWKSWPADFRRSRQTRVGSLLHAWKAGKIKYCGPVKIEDEVQETARNKARALQVKNIIPKNLRQYWKLDEKYLAVGSGAYVEEIPYDLNSAAFDARVNARLEIMNLALPKQEPCYQAIPTKEASSQVKVKIIANAEAAAVNRKRVKELREWVAKGMVSNKNAATAFERIGFNDIGENEQGIWVRDELIAWNLENEEFVKRLRHHLLKVTSKGVFPWEVPGQSSPQAPVVSLLKETNQSMRFEYDRETS